MHSNKQITRKTIAYLPSLRKRASKPGRLGWPRPAGRPDQRLLWRRLGERTLTKVQKSLESCKPLSGGPEEHRPLRIFGGPLNTKILSTHGINEERLQKSASQRGHAASLRPFSFLNAVELCRNNNRNSIQHT